nr:unnamed protein product [Digitaria exilis]
MAAALNDSHCAAIPSGSTAMAAAQPSSSDSLAPPLRRRSRFVFDRRYGWIFDEWKDPGEQALPGGRGMFCALTIARSLVNSAASSRPGAGGLPVAAAAAYRELITLRLPACVPSGATRKRGTDETRSCDANEDYASSMTQLSSGMLSEG